MYVFWNICILYNGQIKLTIIKYSLPFIHIVLWYELKINIFISFQENKHWYYLESLCYSMDILNLLLSSIWNFIRFDQHILINPMPWELSFFSASIDSTFLDPTYKFRSHMCLFVSSLFHLPLWHLSSSMRQG